MTTSSENDPARRDKDYSQRLVTVDGWYAPLYRQALAWIGDLSGCDVLDAGCGAGGMVLALAAAVGDAGSVVALDIAPAHLAATQHRLAATPHAGRVACREGSVDALPFDAAQFDLVWCSHVVHGQPDQLATARELRRVTRRGGRIALREDAGWWPLLPFDPGIGRPGLAQRVMATQQHQFGDWLVQWREQLPGAVRYGAGWPQLLRDAGCDRVLARTFVIDALHPLADAQTIYLRSLIHKLRQDDQLHAALDDIDRATLDAITDPDSPHYALNRPDLHYVDALTVYLGHVME